MRQNPYLQYFLLQLLTLPVILLIFREMGDRKIASVFATSVFLLLCGSLFFREFQRVRFRSWLFWGPGLIFFFFFVLPILLMRWIYWELEFSEIYWGGVSAQKIHQFSSRIFSGWMLCCLIEAWRFKRAKK